MSSPSKTPSLLANAHSVASVSTAASRPYGNRTLSGLVQATALVACFAATALSAAPAHAQSYQPAGQYEVSTTDKIHATVVSVGTYRDRNANRPSEYERRSTAASDQARRRTANLIGSIVNATVGDALGGSNRYTRSMGNIGGQYAGQVARGMVDRGGRSRINEEQWSGNVRVMPEQLSLVTLDVRYPGNRVERVQVRQPAAMSEGLRRGDDVTLEFSVDPRTNEQMFIAVETPASRAKDRYRR